MFDSPTCIAISAKAIGARAVEFFAKAAFGGKPDPIPGPSCSQSLGLVTEINPAGEFCLDWTDVPPGRYALSAKATTQNGAAAVSKSVSVTVASTKRGLTLGESVEPNETTTATPFELVVVATLLAAHPGSTGPDAQPAKKAAGDGIELHFQGASELLGKAKLFLANQNGFQGDLLKSLRIKEYTFNEVLAPIGSAPEGRKKAQTMVGGITTRAGLIKAIRRLFGKEADDIVKGGRLIHYQVEEIKRDHEKRAKVRTQAATAARKKGRKKNLKASWPDTR